MKNVIRRFIARHSESSALKLGGKLCEFYLEGLNNESVLSIESNGESRLLQALARVMCKDPVVFDVGANEGEWAAAVLNDFPAAQVHCFEIVPGTAARLEKRFEHNHGVRVNPFGLSDTCGKVTVTTFDDCSAVSSVTPLPWNPNALIVEAKVTTGDAYLDLNQLNGIDILKIDTEGHDHSVLRGFLKSFGSGCRPVIQFEYGRVCLPSRVQLRDFYELLAPLGYRIGRIYPSTVKLKEYDVFRDETFRMGNYVAVHDAHHELCRAVLGDNADIG